MLGIRIHNLVLKLKQNKGSDYYESQDNGYLWSRMVLGLSVAHGGDSEVSAKLLIPDLGSGYKASGLKFINIFVWFCFILQ